VCDRVGLFHKGKLVLEGTVDELAQRVRGASERGAYRIYVRVEGDAQVLESVVRRLDGVVDFARNGSGYVVETQQDLRAEVASALVGAGGRLLALDMEAPSLDDIYAQYFQHASEMQ
jgi:ABC-2 type transport system ATP-binding protein